MVQRPEDDSGEGDIEKPPCPSSAEASTALDVVANIAVFGDAEGSMWKCLYVFLKHLLEMQQPKLSSFFLEL